MRIRLEILIVLLALFAPPAQAGLAGDPCRAYSSTW